MIAVLVPVLGRPQNAQPLVDSFLAARQVESRLVFLVSATDGDQFKACKETGADIIEAAWLPGPGDFARKINKGYRETDEPWLFQAADDVRFEPGWDIAVVGHANMTDAFVVGTQDGGNPLVREGKHSTHTLIARSYVDDPGASMDGPGSVFSTAYGHQYCDTELVELAKARRVWSFCDEARVTHHHPFWKGRHLMDDTYRRGLGTSREDAAVFKQRRRMWQ